ncbi:MAG: putative RND superfamily exporter protein, partial [Patiriisocius sp.]
MNKLFSIGFWSAVARFILRNRPLILIIIAAITVFMGLQWKHMRFTYSEANLLPDDHEVNLAYDEFLDTFGEEGNLIVMGVKDSTFFTPKVFNAWKSLGDDLQKNNAVDALLSVGNLMTLEKR